MGIKEISEKYASTSLIRAGVQLIPSFGGALDTILASAGVKLQQEKINDFMQRLDSDLNELKAQKRITEENFIERLSTDDAINVIIKCVKETLNSLENEKLTIFKNIAKNYLSSENLIDNSNIEKFIKTTNNLTYTEFKCFFDIWNSQNVVCIIINNHGTYLYQEKIRARPMRIKFGCEEDVEEDWKIPKEKIDCLSKLEKEELITCNHSGSGRMPITGNNSLSEYLYSDKIIYNITEYGDKYIKWVN